MTATSTAIAAGQAVRHRTNKDLLFGRVHRVMGERAVVTWVRRANKSVVQVRSLVPITDAELVAFYHQQEEMYDRIRDEHDRAAPEGCMACVAPPSRTSDENRLFLLGVAAQGNGCS